MKVVLLASFHGTERSSFVSLLTVLNGFWCLRCLEGFPAACCSLPGGSFHSDHQNMLYILSFTAAEGREHSAVLFPCCTHRAVFWKSQSFRVAGSLAQISCAEPQATPSSDFSWTSIHHCSCRGFCITCGELFFTSCLTSLS